MVYFDEAKRKGTRHINMLDVRSFAVVAAAVEDYVVGHLKYQRITALAVSYRWYHASSGLMAVIYIPLICGVR